MFGRSSQANIIFIIILIMFAISNANFDLQSTLLTLPGLILALTLHEYAHAKVSDRLGDPTPEQQGRLTLNPLAHLDPVGTVFLIFAGFGWGKPVQVNSAYYRNPARDMMLVALAGPVSNFIQSIVWFFVYGALYTFAPLEASYPLQMLTAMTLYAGLINVSLGVFNLLPLPPLDGSKILRYFVHGKAGRVLDFLENYSTIILLVLFMTDLTGMIISPIIGWIGYGMQWLVFSFYGLFI
mgnify:CR=1 FL=1